tara:strand:+ start:426 stop:713 length:288 start_codon:yes stop_codon:yes gene_type:complete
MKYNGWTNWETWNFKLWLDNDEITHKIANKIAETSSDVYEASEKLEAWAEVMAWSVNKHIENDSTILGFITDVINSSIKEVNFYEIAEHLQEELN